MIKMKNDCTSSENYWIRFSNNRFGRSRCRNWFSVWKLNRSYSSKSFFTTSIVQLCNFRICFGRSNRSFLFNDCFFTFVLSVMKVIINNKLNKKLKKLNIINNKVTLTLPISSNINLEEILQFIIDNEYWIIPILMIFLLYRIYKSRDPFTNILIEDFPRIGSKEKALKIFNRVY